MHRGFSITKNDWIYGIHFQRHKNGVLQDYVVPDSDKCLEVFLSEHRDDFKVESDSIGEHCPFLGVYEGDICKYGGIYGILCKNKESAKNP